jgi:hypothetical protein
VNYQIIITVDTNDADYVSETSVVSENELRSIVKILDKVSKFEPYEAGGYLHESNWPDSEMIRTDMGERTPMEIYGLSEEECEDFTEYLPYTGHGFHSICHWKVTTVPDEVDWKQFLS